MKSLRVLAVHYNELKRQFEIVKELTADDDTTSLNLHVVPEDAFEWKAAEYGLTTIDQVIDLIVYEPHSEPVNHLALSPEEARTQHLSKVLQRKQALNSNGKTFNKGQARARLQNAGVAQHYVDATDTDPYEVLRTTAPFDAVVIAMKSVAIRRVRIQHSEMRRRGQVRERLVGAERQEAMRRQLFRQENMRREGNSRRHS
jgi:hypothetical protein